MKNTDKNWIKLNRALIDNPIWKIKPFSKGQAWVDLLMLTNHTTGFITVKNGKLIEIKRGDCGYSILGLADRWGWSRGKINRFFDTLTVQKMIQQKIVENHSIISVLNYNTYQSSATNDTTNSTTNGQQTVQQTDTNKNDNNDNNDKNENKEKKIDVFFDNRIQKVFLIYSEKCDNLCKLTFEKKNKQILDKIGEFLKEIDYDFEYINELCETANELETIASNKIDFKSLLNNHIGIMNGKYESSTGLTKKDLEGLFSNE